MRDDDPGATHRLLAGMPKVLLHEHLDGGLRPATLVELLDARGLAPPAHDDAGVRAWFAAHANARSLAAYLECFDLTVSAMASPAALERVAFEAAEDARADAAVLAELRIAPLLFERFGIAGEAAVEALLAGLARSALPTGLIVCAMRHLPPAETERAARLALRWRDRGVVGFDLAGAEHGHPPGEHAAAIAIARDGGLGLTLHAGEADGAERVVEAVRLGATRIGHGVRLADAVGDAARGHLVDAVRDAGAHLEICPTSNLHTGAAASIAAHPIRALWRAGVSVSFHTDNRLVSGVTMSSEAQALVRDAGLVVTDLVAMELAAARASFVGADVREAATQALRRWAAANAVPCDG